MTQFSIYSRALSSLAGGAVTAVCLSLLQIIDVARNDGQLLESSLRSHARVYRTRASHFYRRASDESPGTGPLIFDHYPDLPFTTPTPSTTPSTTPKNPILTLLNRTTINPTYTSGSPPTCVPDALQTKITLVLHVRQLSYCIGLMHVHVGTCVLCGVFVRVYGCKVHVVKSRRLRSRIAPNIISTKLMGTLHTHVQYITEH